MPSAVQKTGETHNAEFKKKGPGGPQHLCFSREAIILKTLYVVIYK